MTPLPSFEELLARFPSLRSALQWQARRRSVPFVAQVTATDCGAACLNMVLGYYGKHVPLDEVRRQTTSARDATTAAMLIDAARALGLRGHAVSLEVDQLKYLERGAILHWEFTHFVVLDRTTKQGIQILDPRSGPCWIPTESVNRQFTGVAIILEPSDDFVSGGEPRSSARRYLERVLSERGFLGHVLVTSALLQFYGIAPPLIMRAAIDRVIPNRDYSMLAVLAIAAAALVLFQFATSIVRAYVLVYLRVRLDARMTLAFFEHLLRLPLEFFHRRSAGDLMSRMASNATVRETVTGAVLSSVLDGTLAVSYLILLLALSPPFAALSIALAAIQGAVFIVTRRKQRRLLALGLDAQAKSQGYLFEALSAVETLKALGAEDRAVERWAGLFAAELNVSLTRSSLDAVIEAVTTAVRVGSSLSMLLMGVSFTMNGTMSLGDMLAVTALAAGFIGPTISLLTTASRLQTLVIHFDRLNDVFETTPEQAHRCGNKDSLMRGGIRLDHVTFSYGPISAAALSDISLSIAPGQFVAIVGRSGSGKSTLARLLVGLFKPQQGRILFDDVELDAWDITRLRSQVGVVSQQAHVFSGTLKSNIALGEPSAAHERIVEAAAIANLHTEIMAMPMGYDTILADRGSSLSGGQQQRISLARALLREPTILVLDEATSQLDTVTELAIHDRLRRLNCTRVVIAHRLSTIRHADCIFVLERGRLIEQGTHEELVQRGGSYRTLVAAQMSAAETH